MRQEESIQLQVCSYLRWQYPDVLFLCDLASGMKMTIGQAVKAQKMRSGKGWPDLMIFQPDRLNGALFIELKKENEAIFLKDGKTPKNEHIFDQISMHRKLLSKGYEVKFAIGFEQAKNIIDNYLKNQNK